MAEITGQDVLWQQCKQELWSHASIRLQRIPTQEEAELLVAEFNNKYEDLRGELADIACSKVIRVTHGQIHSVEVTTTLPEDQHFRYSLAKFGILHGFAVLNMRDRLRDRDTYVEVPEPCVVYYEPSVKRPEAYVPFINLGAINAGYAS